MKTWRAALAAGVALGACAFAQDEAEFSRWMKATGSAHGVLRKLEKKTGTEAVEAAERLGGIYESMIGFWRARNVAGAAGISIEGKAAAVQLASAANAGDAEAARAALQTLGGTCKTCHEAHREQTGENQYKIK